MSTAAFWLLSLLAVAAADWGAVSAKRRWASSGLLALALLLFLARLRFMPLLPPKMAFWAQVLCLVAVMGSAMRLLAAEDGEEAGRALAKGQAAWIAFGLVSPAPLAWSGALLLLWQQALVRAPLAWVLERSPGRVLLAGGLFLALSGAPPFSAFNAYFQVLAPLMTEGAAVQSMQAKLFTGTGLLAVLAILALLYQTGAFGYFYWSRVLPAAPQAGAESEAWRPVPQPWAWACLGASLAWGLAEHWGLPGRLALNALNALHALPSS